MVVEESAVCTALNFSSAFAAEARLTTPTAAKPMVHLLNFIWFLYVGCCLFLVLFMYMHFRVKPVHPGTNTVHLQEQIGETGSFDNNFFCGFCVGGFWCNQLCDNPVEQIPAVPSPGLTLLNYGQP